MDRRSDQSYRNQQKYSNAWNDDDYHSEYDYDPRTRQLERERKEQRRREDEEQRSQQEEERKAREREGQNTMSSWFQRATGSTQAQFAATALVSGAVVAGAIFGYQAVQRRDRLQDLKAGIPEVGSTHLADKVSLAEARK